VFHCNNPASTPGKGVTQYGRALYELNVDTLCANSSQTKGRVERANLTLQDRLVKELRLRKIDTKEAANAYAPHFIADFNERFGKVPRSAYNAHRPLRADENLDLILTCRVSRCVSATLTVQYDRVMYLLDDTAANRGLIHQYLDVYEYPDGRIEIRANGAALACRQYDRLSDIDQGGRWSITSGWGTCWRSRSRYRWSVITGASRARPRGPTRANQRSRRCGPTIRASNANSRRRT